MSNSTTKKYSFFDFNLSFENSCFKKNELSVCESYNVDISSNVIKPLGSFQSFLKTVLSEQDYEALINNNEELLSKIKFLYPYKFISPITSKQEIRIYALDENNSLYEINSSSHSFTNLNVKFKNNPIVFESNSFIYFYSINENMIFFDRYSSRPIYMVDFCDLKSFVRFRDCLFITVKSEPFKVYNTAVRDFEGLCADPNIYDSIKLDEIYGEVIALKAFNNNLYIIQQFAISKYTYANGNLNFSSLFPVASKIMVGSVEQVDDFIVFLTTNGLYVFDGSNLKNIFSREIECILSHDYKAVVFNEKYYLLCSYSFDNKEKTIILELNLENNKINFYYEEGIFDIYTVKNQFDYKLMLVTKNESYEILELSQNSKSKTNKLIKFNKLILDDAPSKLISELSIFSKGEYTLKVITDQEEKLIVVSTDLKLRNLGIRGNYFQFEFSSKSDFCIEAIIITTENFAEKL